MTRSRASRRAAFTLIELVASAVLTAIMMAGLLNIVWSAVRESNQLRANEVDRFPFTMIAAQMRTDFQNARGISVVPSGVVLHGFLGTGGTPGRVTYETQRVRDRLVLIRTDEISRELAWVGLKRFLFEPLATTEQGETLPLPETGGLPDAPSRFRVTIVGNDGRILFREVMHHHDS